MNVLGIDPGTATTGYGLICTDNNSCSVMEWGLIETVNHGFIEKRLKIIYDETLKLLKRTTPDLFVIEKIFFSNNAKTAISVGQAQGVMLLAAAKSGVTVAEYAPGTIKKMVTGSGRANKKEVQQAIRKIFGNKVRSKAKKRTHFDNAADALAIALCHIRKGGEKSV